MQQLPDRATSKQVAPWRPGECGVLDSLVMEIVSDFGLPDPYQVSYTIKMNWYTDGLARVSTHRHDNWTLLLSLGTPRILTVDKADILMENGDVILFGTQSHGVPEMPQVEDGRFSLVFMFEPSSEVERAAKAVASGHRAFRKSPAICEPMCRSVPALAEEKNKEEQEWEDDQLQQALAVSLQSDADLCTSDKLGTEYDGLLALCSLGFDAGSALEALSACDGRVDDAALLLCN